MKRGRYAKLAAYYWLDPAIVEAGEAAELLYVRALSACADRLNDGHIDGVLKSELLKSNRKRGAALAHLLRVGLWVPCTTHRDCWVIRNYLDWNRSAEDIRAACRRDAARKRDGRRASPSGRTSNGVSERTSERTPKRQVQGTSLPKGQGQGSTPTDQQVSPLVNGSPVDPLRARLAQAARAHRIRDRERADPIVEAGGSR